MKQYMGIDASTQSLTAVIIDAATGGLVARHAVQFGKDLPGYHAPNGFIAGGSSGEVHADPLMWLDALDLLLENMQAAGVDFAQISAISGAGQQHGSVYLNAEWFSRIRQLDPRHDLNEQIRPCLARTTAPIWMDTSTAAECAEIAQVMGGAAQVGEISGSQPVERFTGPQIRRFFKTSPQAYATTARIHLVSSFFASILSGSDAPIDTGDGAGMNLLNLNALDWDTQLLAATAPQLAGRLPTVVPAQTIVGKISPYFGKYGFRTDTRIVAFSGDNNSSLVGMGAQDPGKVVISLGTSDTFFAAMPVKLSDPNGFGHVFGNPCGGFMTLQCFRNGSLARERIKDELDLSWADFDVTAFERTPAGNDGNLMLPFYAPEITPRLDIHAPVLQGSEAFRAGREPMAQVRACVEGQILNMRLHASWMQLQPNEVFLTGGASRSDGIAQTIADIFQAKVQRLKVADSVALGAALRAAQTGGGEDLAALQGHFCAPLADSAVTPQAECAPIYAAALDRFAALLQSFQRGCG